MPNICKYCGTEFDSKNKLGGHVSHCSKNPFVHKEYTCDYCGEKIKGKHTYTFHKNHCELNPLKKTYKSPVSRNKSVDEPGNCKYCGKYCKNDNSLRNHERLCKENPDKQIIHRSNVSSSKLKGKQGWSKGLTKDTDERVNRCSIGVNKYYENHEGTFKGKHHSVETVELLSKIMSDKRKQKPDYINNSVTHRSGYYKGILCQSSWELAYVLYAIDHNINFVRNEKSFSYIFEDKEHSYFPDFYLPDCDTYVEIKGWYDPKSQAKVAQFKQKIILLQAEEMKPILNYVTQTYGLDFTSLYEKK